jgi:hypothetical protein
MFTRKNRRNLHTPKTILVMAVVGAAVSMTAFAGIAQADSQMTSDYCAASLPALQRAADGEQSGHLQALKTLEACDTLLGQNAAATFVGWQIDRELDRADPHDD